jgi:hypothetical protein
LSEKGPNLHSIWEISIIEKGTWTITVLSTPATFYRRRTGIGLGCVDVGSCKGTGACAHDWVWGGDKGRKGAGPEEGFSGKRREGPSGEARDSGEVGLMEGGDP